ncbi:hypothetical protein F4819DRAFT_481534 [Hypoxylon fuscum]|nr:hypothetical protein F4819DRAFT_481534 [Hypoxylon fuscum]
MGRLEPLTSLALGRSPYDDVVPGEGEADPHEPDKQYDNTGRLVNPLTKRIIKDVIRAHNEVMLVIGVAEPENNGINAADLEIAKQYQEYESDTGRTLYQLGSSLGIFQTWGVLNIRRRLLVYKTRADVSLHGALEYIRFHLHIFTTMQRLDLIPASQWLPGPKFFLPFSSSSPFSAPPLPESLDFLSIASWVGKLVINLAPYATYYACGCIWQSTCAWLRSRIRKRLPRPIFSFSSTHRVAPSTASTQRQPIPESPTLGAADREIRHQNPETDEATTSVALDVQSSGEAIPVEAIRRQSTFSSRGGEGYGTDEEDSEMVNPTLISFDVDTSESTEQPTGVWSAELRPSFAGDSRQQPKEAPLYIVNPLTSLPSVLASDILAEFATNILTIPLDCHVFPIVARAFAHRRGLPFDDIGRGGILGGLTIQGVFNMLQLDLIRLLTFGQIWGLTTVLSQWLHVTEEEWKEIRKEEEHW